MSISRLILGTAQLGMPYGIANRTGVPDRDEAFAILDAAREAGLDRVDTASAYGGSESLIGEWMSARGKRLRVVTKLPALPGIPRDPAEASAFYRSSLQNALDRLRIDSVWGLLLHEPADLLAWPGEVGPALAEMRTGNLTERIGASLYRPGDVSAAASRSLDLLQVPVNIFDSRYLTNFLTSRSGSTALLARSCFLQGLLFLEPDEAEARVPGSARPLRGLRELSRASGLSIRRLTLGYAMSLPGIDSVLVGVETRAQLRENLEAAEGGPLPEDLVEAARASFASVPDTVRDPSLWRARAA